MKILDRYIFKEIVVPFLLSLLIFTGILFLARSLKLVDLVVNKDVPISDIAILFFYLIPKFFEVAIPMSLLLAVIVAFGRLSSSSEIVVMRSIGINMSRMAIPVLIFSAMCFIFSLITSLWIRPWANYNLSLGVFEIAKKQASAGLIAGVFNDLGQLTLYAEELGSKAEQLKNVIISDRRNPEEPRTFFAQHGQFVADDSSQTITLRLYDGSIHIGSGLNHSVTSFDINNINMQQDELLAEKNAEGKRFDEMYFRELLKTLEELKTTPEPLSSETLFQMTKLIVELQSRFSIPMSCLFISFIAMALGIQPSRGGRTWGPVVNVVVGILIILLYYLLMAIFKALGEQSVMPPAVAMWTPNLGFAIIAVFLFKKMGSERWLAVSETLGDFISFATKKLKLQTAKSET